jgi:hypothetical protein
MMVEKKGDGQESRRAKRRFKKKKKGANVYIAVEGWGLAQ